MSDLHELTAVEALARMRTKEVSPVELLEAVLARAAAIEATVKVSPSLSAAGRIAAATS